MDRRAVFFAVAAVVLLLLTPLAPGEFRWLVLGLAALYTLLALASLADWHSARSQDDGRDQADRTRS